MRPVPNQPFIWQTPSSPQVQQHLTPFSISPNPIPNSDSLYIITSPQNPSEPIYSDSTLRVGLRGSSLATTNISFVTEWYRCKSNYPPQLVLSRSDPSVYECSTLDIGCMIEVRIRYQDPSQQQIPPVYKNTVNRIFGPVRMEAELGKELDPYSVEYFKVRMPCDNSMAELNAILNAQNFILLSSDSSEYYFKTNKLLDIIELRTDCNNLVVLNLRTSSSPHAQQFSRFASRLVGIPKTGTANSVSGPGFRGSNMRPLDSTEIFFQNHRRRNLFLVKISMFVSRNSSNSVNSLTYSNAMSQYNNNNNNNNSPNHLHPGFGPAPNGSSQSPTNQRQFHLMGRLPVNSRKNSDRSMSQSPRKKNASSNHRAVNPPVNPSGRRPQKLSLQSSQQYMNSNDVLNVISSVPNPEPAAALTLDLEFQQLMQGGAIDPSTKNTPTKPPALNLRDSFDELQQKHIKSQIDPKLKNGNTPTNNNSSNLQQGRSDNISPVSMSSSNLPVNSMKKSTNTLKHSNGTNTNKNEQNGNDTQMLRKKLDDAYRQIRSLNQELQRVKKQNYVLKQTDLAGEVSRLLSKVQQLTVENKRLEGERTQIITDKIATEVKFKKEKHEKESYKLKYEALMNGSGRGEANKKEPSEVNYPLNKNQNSNLPSNGTNTPAPAATAGNANTLNKSLIEYSKSTSDFRRQNPVGNTMTGGAGRDRELSPGKAAFMANSPSNNPARS